MKKLTRKKAIKLATRDARVTEMQRCAEIARNPYGRGNQMRIPSHYDPHAFGSGYLQASDDIRAKILGKR